MSDIDKLPKWERDLLSQLPAEYDPLAEGSPSRCEPILNWVAALTVPPMIESLEESRRFIDNIDFTSLKMKLQSPTEGGPAWSEKKVNEVENLYKNWLFLRRKYLDEVMPPSKDLDTFWHAHILDSIAYHRDTAAIFGCYFHHFPYFGMGGKEDYMRLQEAFETTLKRYREEYGEELQKK